MSMSPQDFAADLAKCNPSERFAWCSTAVAVWESDAWRPMYATVLDGWSVAPGVLVDGKCPWHGVEWTEIPWTEVQA